MSEPRHQIQYAIKDVEVNILSWNQEIPKWRKKNNDERKYWSNKRRAARGRQFTSYIGPKGGFRANIKKWEDLGDDMVAKENGRLCEIIHTRWFREEIDWDCSVPAIPVVIKQIIEKYAATPNLASRPDFRRKYFDKMV